MVGKQDVDVVRMLLERKINANMKKLLRTPPSGRILKPLARRYDLPRWG